MDVNSETEHRGSLECWALSGRATLHEDTCQESKTGKRAGKKNAMNNNLPKPSTPFMGLQPPSSFFKTPPCTCATMEPFVLGFQDPKPAEMPLNKGKRTKTNTASSQGLASNWAKSCYKTREKTPKGQMVPFSRPSVPPPDRPLPLPETMENHASDQEPLNAPSLNGLFWAVFQEMFKRENGPLRHSAH